MLQKISLFLFLFLLTISQIACNKVSEQDFEPDFAKDARFAKFAVMDDSPAQAAFAVSESSAAQSNLGAINSGSRQVMKSARLTLKVDDFAKSLQKIRQFVEDKKGYIGRNEQRGKEADKLSGTMIIKVPVKHYNAALEEFKGLGSLYELSETAEDVSDQVVDLGSRTRNALKLEQRILDILTKQTGSIRDIVEAERELARVRTNIEDMQSQMKGLMRKVNYSTFTLHLFVSGSKDVEARSWYGPILKSLRDMGFVIASSIGLLITLIFAITPWIVVIYLLRRFYKNRKAGKGKKVVKQ